MTPNKYHEPRPIEKNVPIPSNGYKSIYPFRDMEVGDSFTVDITKRSGVKSSSYTWGQRQTPVRKFTTRVIDEKTARCWRIE